jgi:hypothetical protein
MVFSSMGFKQGEDCNVVRKTAFTVFFGLMAASAHADVSYFPTLGLINPAARADGTAIADGTYVMVLDRNNNGWNGNSYLTQSNAAVNSNTWLWDTNDLLMDRGQISDGMAFPGFYFTGNPVAGIPGYSVDVNDYYILWFDKPYDAAATGPGGGVAYGAELLGKACADGSALTPNALGGIAALTTVAEVTGSWHNPLLSGDVDGDGSVTLTDAQIIIDKLNAEGPHQLRPDNGDPLFADGGKWWDVTGDAIPYISPLDALRVINSLQVGGQSLAVAVVPEPASVLLMLAGGGLLAGRRRSRAAA